MFLCFSNHITIAFNFVCHQNTPFRNFTYIINLFLSFVNTFITFYVTFRLLNFFTSV
nr:MAG TPA: hypothetical protein [Caudoviricetes sp.]